MRVEPCTCPKCQVAMRPQLPLIEVVELPPPDFYFGKAWAKARAQFIRNGRRLVSPPAQKAVNPASGVGVFCNGSTAPNKGRSLKGTKP